MARLFVLGRAARLLGAGLVLGSLALAPASCGKGQTAGQEAPQVLPPVPAPAGLAAEVFIAKPNATWARLRAMVGGPLQMMPATYPMLVVTLLGLPPTAIDDIDADVPTLGAILSDGKSEMPVLAIHVKSGSKLLSLLTAGPDARFLARVDEPSHVTLLEPKPGQTSLSASLGMTGNYLLVGYAPDGLLKAGPYAARTLPTRAMPGEDVAVVATREGLAGPLKARFSSWWVDTKRQLEEADRKEREKHGGSAPTFGDPGAALGKADQTFEAVFAMMGDLAEGRLTVTLDEAGAHAKAKLTPASNDGPASREIGAMLPGSTDPLLDLPDTAVVAVLTRDSPEVRAKSAADQLDAIEKLFAGKMSEAEKARVNEVLSSWSKGRGDWLSIGVQLSPDRRAFYAKTPVADEATLDKGVRSTLELLKVPAFSEPLKHWLGETKMAAPVPLGEGGKGELVKIERKPSELKLDGKDKLEGRDKKPEGKDKERKKEPERLELAWTFDEKTAAFVLAPDGKAALKEATKPADGATLRSDPEVKKAVEALGNDASFALLVMPIRAVSSLLVRRQPAQKPPAAPVLVSFGRTGQDGWFRVDAAPAALREIAKAQRMN